SPFPGGRGRGEMEMNAQATKLQAAENDLKQLMAEVTRAVEKAQEAVARITSKAAATTAETEPTPSSRYSAYWRFAAARQAPADARFASSAAHKLLFRNQGRLLTRSPRRRGRAASAAIRGRALWRWLGSRRDRIWSAARPEDRPASLRAESYL